MSQEQQCVPSNLIHCGHGTIWEPASTLGMILALQPLLTPLGYCLFGAVWPRGGHANKAFHESFKVKKDAIGNWLFNLTNQNWCLQKLSYFFFQQDLCCFSLLETRMSGVQDNWKYFRTGLNRVVLLCMEICIELTKKENKMKHWARVLLSVSAVKPEISHTTFLSVVLKEENKTSPGKKAAWQFSSWVSGIHVC